MKCSLYSSGPGGELCARTRNGGVVGERRIEAVVLRATVRLTRSCVKQGPGRGAGTDAAINYYLCNFSRKAYAYGNVSCEWARE